MSLHRTCSLTMWKRDTLISTSILQDTVQEQLSHCGWHLVGRQGLQPHQFPGVSDSRKSDNYCITSIQTSDILINVLTAMLYDLGDDIPAHAIQRRFCICRKYRPPIDTTQCHSLYHPGCISQGPYCVDRNNHRSVLNLFHLISSKMFHTMRVCEQ